MMPCSVDRPFLCNVCQKAFGYKHVLQNHERTHTGEKPFQCKQCQKKFTRDHHLKTHMRLHTGEKPYSCSHCDKQFVQVANLRRHLRTHTGERPYVCDFSECQSKFSDSNQLKAHKLIHKGVKPFGCDKCLGKFRRRHHLNHHKCPKDEANLGKPRRGRRPRAYEDQIGPSSIESVVNGLDGIGVSSEVTVGTKTGSTKLRENLTFKSMDPSAVEIRPGVLSGLGVKREHHEPGSSSTSPSAVHHLLGVKSPLLTPSLLSSSTPLSNSNASTTRPGSVHSISGSLTGDETASHGSAHSPATATVSSSTFSSISSSSFLFPHLMTTPSSTSNNNNNNHNTSCNSNTKRSSDHNNQINLYNQTSSSSATALSLAHHLHQLSSLQQNSRSFSQSSQGFPPAAHSGTKLSSRNDHHHHHHSPHHAHHPHHPVSGSLKTQSLHRSCSTSSPHPGSSTPTSSDPCKPVKVTSNKTSQSSSHSKSSSQQPQQSSTSDLAISKSRRKPTHPLKIMSTKTESDFYHPYDNEDLTVSQTQPLNMTRSPPAFPINLSGQINSDNNNNNSNKNNNNNNKSFNNNNNNNNGKGSIDDEDEVGDEDDPDGDVLDLSSRSRSVLCKHTNMKLILCSSRL